MAIEAVKNPSISHLQGSRAGADTVKVKVQAETAKPEAPEIKKTDSSPIAEPKGGNAGESAYAPIQDAGKTQETVEVSKGNEAMRKAVEEINKNIKHSEAIFGFHEGTNRVTIKIVDRDSKEVLKEFPPEKTLDMIAKVWEMAGLMVDQKL